MSPRARVLPSGTPVHSPGWRGLPPPPVEAVEPLAALPPRPAPAEPPPVLPEAPAAAAPRAAAEPAVTPDQQAHLAALEREAFTKGYAQGERAGLEAGGKRAEAMLRRVAQTIEELGSLRQTLIHQTERQMVQLALTLARRVVHREISLDPELAAALAHVALDKLGTSTPATIRLNPEDYTVVAGDGERWGTGVVTVVPDPAIARVGELCELRQPGGQHLMLEVVGFREGYLQTVPLGSTNGIRPGDVLVARGGSATIPVGQDLLGRVLDGLGQPLDGLGPVRGEADALLYPPPINPLARDPIVTPMGTGVRTIDSLLTCGRGQRVGLFGGSGVGKSTLLGMMARGTSADVAAWCAGIPSARKHAVSTSCMRSCGTRTAIFSGTSRFMAWRPRAPVP